MTMKEEKPIFKKSMIGCLIILILGIYLSTRGTKEKDEFQSITGKIDYYEKTFENINYRNKGNHRFIYLENAPIIFDLFIRKETGDFSPKFEKLDSLGIGDEITVFYDAKTLFQKNSDPRINKTVQFIDKEKEPHFIRGNKDKYGGYAAIAFSIIMSIVFVILHRIGKII